MICQSLSRIFFLVDEPNFGGPSDTITCSLATGNLTVHLDVNAIQVDGSLRAVFKVSIDILDLDDNQPQFDQPVWQRQLKEALYRQGRRIDLPKARDRDLLASHRIIHYRLEPDDPDSIFRFEMSHMDTPSLVLRQDLDAESQESYSLVLVAFNPTSGSGRIFHHQQLQQHLSEGLNESRLQINIAVVDMNDNEPYFEKPVVNITVPEDQALGSVIYRDFRSATDLFRCASVVRAAGVINIITSRPLSPAPFNGGGAP
ncbi:unnamed protein product [Schistocephalus solidus]|uniref:CA domain-containing protein n=1 Tax=Schistocephalus solidus TaxID=70667 RepID=A0A183SN89_SCHSO|nr:unnamed protein product [Schistocephalus solidus]